MSKLQSACMATLLLVACATSNMVTAPPDLSIRMEADSSAVVGGTVRLILRIKNVGPQPASIGLRISDGLAFDPVVRDASGQVIWERLAGQLTAGTALMLVVPPGTERTYEALWNLRDQTGKLVAPGDYTVIGRVLLDNGGVLAPENSPIRIKVVSQ